MSNIIVKRIKVGAFWNFFLAFGRQGLNIIATFLLGRLLSPEDYGLIGMIAIFIGVSEGFIDAGLGGALVKKRNAVAIDFSTLNVYNLTLSISLYALIWIIAPYVGQYYDNLQIINLLRLYSLVIITDAFAIVPKVKLHRDLKFKQLALSTVISGFIGLLCAVIAALLKMGVYSLIIQILVTSFLNASILFLISKYSLSFKFSLSSFKESFVFGFNTSVANMIKDILENIFTNIIAKISPLTITGYYTQSFKIQNVLSSVQQKVIDGSLFPILSKEKDSEIIRLSLIINNYAQFVFIFFYFAFILAAKEIVLILLGNEWVAMIPYFKVLLLVGLFQSLTSLNRNILKTLAKTKDILLNEVITLFIVIIILIFIPFTVTYILMLMLFYAIIRFVFSIIILSKNEIINVKCFCSNFFKVLIIPLSCILIIGVLKYLCDKNYLFVWVISYIFMTFFVFKKLQPSFYYDLKRRLFN